MTTTSPDQLNYYLGKHKACFTGYSSDEQIRNGAASGGGVSAFLIYLLDNNIVDGCVVSKLDSINGTLTPTTFIATTKEDILSARTSIYIDFSIIKNLKLLKDFDGKLAVVGVPCELTWLRNIMKQDPELQQKISILVGLLCGHVSTKKLLINYLNKKHIKEEDIKKFTFRKEKGRGRTFIELNNGTTKDFHWWDFGAYQNLWIHAWDYCFRCSDHTAEDADISFGDIWIKSEEYEDSGIKKSGIITRNDQTESIIKQMVTQQTFTGKEVHPEIIYKGNKRGIHFHKDLKARAIVGKLFGKKIVYDRSQKTSIWHIFAAFLVYTNNELSKTKVGNAIIFMIPKPLIKAYMYFLKLFSQFH